MDDLANNAEHLSLQYDPGYKIKSEQYEVLNAWPHDCKAFTEGLEFFNGVLYESTGGDKDTPDIGLSSIRRFSLTNSRASKTVAIDEKYFAEGLTICGDRIFQLTYRSRVGFIYNLSDLTRVGEFHYEGEGWGLTNDNTNLIMSDGTSIIRFLDPANFKVVHAIPVTEGNEPLDRLNELEFANGRIYANVWYQKRIVAIDPSSGSVVDSIDLTNLCRPYDQTGVLNGIAYDKKLDRWFVTGKKWPKLFEIRFTT